MTMPSKVAQTALFYLANAVRNGTLSMKDAQNKAREYAAEAERPEDRVMFIAFAESQSDRLDEQRKP